MAITTSSGVIDEVTGWIIPQSNGTWAATSATTWDNLLSWEVSVVDPLIWVTNVYDFGRVGTFNIRIDSVFEGDLRKYEVWTSNTGEFNGEESYYEINEGDSNILSFTGRYVIVSAWVYNTAQTARLKSMTVRLSDQSLELDLPDVSTTDLPVLTAIDTSTTTPAYVLDLGRGVSSILSAQYQPHFVAPGPYMSTGYAIQGYSTLGYRYNTQNEYFEEIDNGQVLIPSIVKKTVKSSTLPNGVGTAFMIQDQNGDYVQGRVDVRLRVLPEQYMQNGQLQVR